MDAAVTEHHIYTERPHLVEMYHIILYSAAVHKRSIGSFCSFFTSGLSNIDVYYVYD